MLVEEIMLYGYRRFKMDRIKNFHWTPKSRLGLILSGNGAGKSSLLNEINPMPANKNDFITGGIKRFVCSQDNVRYILVSDFTKGQLHSFKRVIDGLEEELNPSGTVTIQKELVEKILRYDNNIHAILTGQLCFTAMSPSQRKELLMTICPLELDYATKLYETIRVMARDDVGAIKHQQTKCVDLETRLAAIEITDNEETVIYLEQMVEKLLPFKGSSDIDLEALWNTISSINTNLDEMARKWDRWKNDVRLPSNIKSIMDLNTAIGQKEGLLQGSIKQLEVLTKRALEVNSVIDQMQGNDLSKEQLEERTLSIRKEMSTFGKHFSLTDYIPNSIERFNRISSDIENSLPTDIINIFPSDEVIAIQLQQSRLLASQASIQFRLKQEEDKLTHLRDDKSTIVCTRCATKLSISGKDIDEEIQRVEKIIEEGKALLEKREKELKEHSNLVYQVDRYEQYSNRLSSLIGSDNAFLTFFNRSDFDIDKILTNSAAFFTAVQQFNQYTGQCERFIQLQTELDSYTVALKQYELLGGDITQTSSDLEKSIEQEVIFQRTLKNDIDYFMRAAKMYDYFFQITERSEKMLTTLLETFREWVTGSIQQDARRRLTDIYARLGSIKHIVNQKAILTKALEDAHADIQQLKERQSDLDVLLSILSPTKGIVADQMTAFINSYIEQINKVIDQIWEQSMIVRGCHQENGGLDYKFPIDTEGQIVPDISLGSKGMCDVIDLGFVLVMRQYLNLVDYPIFMDETGSTFDSAHRNNLLKFIKNLLDTQQCQQIFMINHYADWHGGLSNYEAVVLDDRNIVVPSNYNQNVKINDGV